MARVEAGLLIIGADYAHAGPGPTDSHTPSGSDSECLSSPFELGLGRFVDLDKPDFVGREALLAEQAAGGPRRALVGLDIDWKAVVDAHVVREVAPSISPRVEWVAKRVTVEGRTVGRASSVTWSPTLGKLIGFGHLVREVGGVGSQVAVEWEVAGTGEHVAVPAMVTALPFLSLRRT